MVAPGNENKKGTAAQGQARPMKAAEAVVAQQGAYQSTPRPDAQLSSEVLHQRRKLPFCPAKAAVGGFAFLAGLTYLTLYSKKKPEATALDVAKVTSGTASPKNTHPGK